MDLISRAGAIASGVKRYFTGEQCKFGHAAERRVSDHGCVECSRVKARSTEICEKRRGYFANHQRNYRRNHPDRVAATDRKRQPKNTKLTRLRRAKDPEQHRSVLRKSFQKHKAKRMAENRAWIAANPEPNSRLQRAAKARRRALERGSEGSYTRQDIERMHAAQNFICAACPADISENYHVDHMHPLSRGGSNWPSNLQLLCGPCNRSKGKKTMAEWLAWKAEMLTAPPRARSDGRDPASA